MRLAGASRVPYSLAGALGLLAVLSVGQSAAAQACVPKCRSGYVCSPEGQCVSACNPPCPTGEVCTPQGECVSPCNPACTHGEVCTAAGECVASQAPTAPVSPPDPPAAPSPSLPPPPSATDHERQPLASSPSEPVRRAGFLQAGALLGHFSYRGERSSGTEISAWGLLYGVEAAGGLHLSESLRLGAGLQYFVLPSPEGLRDNESVTGETGRGGVVGGYLGWRSNFGLRIDGILGYGGLGNDSTGGWGLGVFPGLGYETRGATRLSVMGRVFVMATSADHESGSATGFQLVASVGVH